MLLEKNTQEMYSKKSRNILAKKLNDFFKKNLKQI